MAVDAHVFYLYRFHLSAAMLDLFFNASGQVIELSAGEWRRAAGELALLGGYLWLAVTGGLRLASRRIRVGAVIPAVLAAFAGANAVNVCAAAAGNPELLEIGQRLPLYYPLSMNTQLTQWGWISAADRDPRPAGTRAGGLLRYPLRPLRYAPPPSRPDNVLLITVDSLRADMLTPATMPHTAAYARDGTVFLNHYSGGNATRGGIFALFYGLPPRYWDAACTAGIPAAVVTAARARGYRLGIFSSATLSKPEFDLTVFAGEPALRLGSTGAGVLTRDAQAVAACRDFLAARGADGQPFFSWVFLDNVHALAYPPAGPSPFSPARRVSYLDLTAETDPEPYFNVYKNAVYHADQNVRAVLTALEAAGLAERTVVLITSDHGQEFNDNGLNFWGHNSNYTDAQLKIPLVMRIPGRPPATETALTVSYDVSATLLQEVFGVLNEPQDYGLGQNLLAPAPRPYFVAGSYTEDAVIEPDRIVLIDGLGMLRFKDRTYRNTDRRERDQNLLEAFRDMIRYASAPGRRDDDE